MCTLAFMLGTTIGLIALIHFEIAKTRKECDALQAANKKMFDEIVNNK